VIATTSVPERPATPVLHDPVARRRVLALDGVRGFAALAVMCFHFGRDEIHTAGSALVGAITQFGWTGVDLFFVLSGYLITGILLDSRESPRFFRSFYMRRALRIFPLYFTFVGAFVYLISPRIPGPPSDLASRQVWLWTYLGNIDIALHHGYSAAGSNANVLWSLSIEEQFYFLFPVAIYLLSRRGVGVLAVGLIVLSIAARAVLARADESWYMGYFMTVARLDGLGLGAVLALLARSAHALDRLAPIARALILPLAACVLAVTIRSHGFRYTDWSALVLGMPAMTLIYAAVLLLTITPSAGIVFARVFEHAALRFLGKYSYSLYIWHTMTGGFVRRAGVKQTHLLDLLHSGLAASLGVLVVKILVSIGVAMLSYRLIERPFLRFRERVAREPPPCERAPPPSV
jgi:peptidoglycan/LPS O-acetylase OafA/YrhL